MITDENKLLANLDTVKEFITENLTVMKSEKNPGYFYGIPGNFTQNIGPFEGTLRCSFYGLREVSQAAEARATRIERDVNALSDTEAEALLAKLRSKLGK